jgi:hypothetical protein
MRSIVSQEVLIRFTIVPAAKPACHSPRQPHWASRPKIASLSAVRSIEERCKMKDTINSLTDEYQNYCASHGLPLLSADDLLGKLTELDNPSETRCERICWLTKFHQPLGRR